MGDYLKKISRYTKGFFYDYTYRYACLCVCDVFVRNITQTNILLLTQDIK